MFKLARFTFYLGGWAVRRGGETAGLERLFWRLQAWPEVLGPELELETSRAGILPLVSSQTVSGWS